jgi:uncharacterized protein involved in exopolysaccharide biosynthesis
MGMHGHKEVNMKIGLLLKQQIRINTLENQLETLKKQLREGLYGNFIMYANNAEEIESLRGENKRLRQKIKEMKEQQNEKHIHRKK